MDKELLSQINSTRKEIEELREKIDKINKAKEQELEPFKDDYFKNLDTKTIAKLAKKSIRITAEYCKLENILRDIKEICLQQNLKADFTACEILDIINKAKE